MANPAEALIRIEDDRGAIRHTGPGWRILVVDDDEQVHLATRLALEGMDFRGRPLMLDSCYSAWEAFEYLADSRDVAVILLDVVMEDERAGLNLVRRIREELHNEQVRIVLRTGQPGYAPELEVIRQYDINDYKAKTELTVTRLASSVITALRSYEQIVALDRHRRGLEQVIKASADLFTERSLNEFSAGVLIQLAAQMGIEPEGVLCAQGSVDGPIIVAAAGRFANHIRKPLSALGNAEIEAALLEAFSRREGFKSQGGDILYLQSGSAHPAAIYMCTPAPVDEQKRDLLRLFTINVALGFETATLFEHLRAVAFTDPLTALPNRSGFITILDRPLPGQGMVVILLDLDQFHFINARLGFQVADALLRAVGHRLVASFPEAIAISRFGGDRFALALPTLPAAEPSLAQLESRLEAAFETGFDVAGRHASLSATSGCSYAAPPAGGWGDSRPAGDLLVQQASLALKDAKLRSRGRLVPFNTELERRNTASLALLAEFRTALRNRELVLHYQPKLDLSTRRPVGVEALVRWQSPKHGLLMPAQFLDLAEASGLIVPMGLMVLEMAIRQRRAWRVDGLDIPVAVNVCALQVQQADFLQGIDRVLAAQEVTAEGLEMEITESVFVGDDERTFDHIQGLRDRGFGIALDDFGTGYSSLSYLNRLPATTVKVDRRFVQGMNQDAKSDMLVRAIIQVAAVIDAQVVAEGVETEDQADRLRALGVPVAQGFLYSPGVPADRLAAWWLEHDVPAAR
ncbi:EAL domain-containing response regulator [Nitrospirillum iridis]|uniref:Diguanylate cyclase (GGDEF)-like protein n=1 Tax=Nitrospirillum iridis TaxID=765888 RepID=A0A7X0ECG2_9PROT|nr:EAL domain-containing protein [Nitrospirillum iridis]MBB6251682.1 diguanylate cyclase (GGDEF)-like protein [Nitrospirillum iridis]